MDRNQYLGGTAGEIVRVVIEALRASIGDFAGSGRTNQVFYLPVYKGDTGAEVKNPHALWREQRNGPDKFDGGVKIFSGGEGQDCVRLEVGKWTSLPNNAAGKFLFDYLTTTPHETERCLFRTIPTVTEATYDAAQNPIVRHLTEAEYQEVIGLESTDLNDWKVRAGLSKRKSQKAKK